MTCRLDGLVSKSVKNHVRRNLTEKLATILEWGLIFLFFNLFLQNFILFCFIAENVSMLDGIEKKLLFHEYI